jgi:hypothetical protein
MRHDEFIAKDTLDEELLERTLRRLPARVPPVGLTTSLRVIASRERQRRLERRTWRHALATWYGRTCMAANEVMRTLALPFAGGVVSAIVLFSAWLVPTYPLHASGGVDVPTMLTTEASLKSGAPTGVSRGDVVVEVTVNGEGRMTDYDIVSVSGAVALQDATVCRRLENFLDYSLFVPATAFGQPTAGKVRVPISASQLRDSRGTTFLIDLRD